MLLHKPIAYLIGVVTAALLLFLPLQSTLGASDLNKTDNSQTEIGPLIAIDEDILDEDIFDELPFAQRRQVLREEVERNPKRNLPPDNPRQYNWLIR